MNASRSLRLIAPLVVVVLGYYAYFSNYEYPSKLFWDENFHIASAQRYLHGTFFMEPHPPLGKLLIALGESLVGVNETHDQFLNEQVASNVPEGFSFRGYRFFPALLGWLAALPVYGIFLSILGSPLSALACTALYLGNNAQIASARGAMLDSTLFFFVATALAAYFAALRTKADSRSFLRWSILFGVSTGLALATKLNAVVLLIFFAALLAHARAHSGRRFVSTAFASGASLLLSWGAVWAIHIGLGVHVNPVLDEQGYFKASAQYREDLQSDQGPVWYRAPIYLRDNLIFTAHYQAGVPALNLCDNDEQGSPPALWPLGGSAISYRWERIGELTRYLYLVANPVVWGVGLCGLIVAAALVLSAAVRRDSALQVSTRPFLPVLGAYVLYMILAMSAERVLYLHHYLIPLFLTLILCALVVRELAAPPALLANALVRGVVLLLLCVAVLESFVRYMPLTYYLPISDQELEERELFKFWNLRCGSCTAEYGFASPKSSRF